MSKQIYNLLSFYKTPPKFSKNFIDVVVLKVDLGYMNKISGEEFMNQFFLNNSEYGFKILTQPIIGNINV